MPPNPRWRGFVIRAIKILNKTINFDKKSLLARICNPRQGFLLCLDSLRFLKLLYKTPRAMSDKYKIWDQEKAYFLTLTVVGWIDVFTRKNHKMAIINSLKYCQDEKGLVLFAYCLMPSHLHIIARAEGSFKLSDILRDFKKYTSKAIIKQVLEEPESRREWMMEYFLKAGEDLRGIKNYKFWRDGNHAELISSNKFFNEKLDYIHNNPVEELVVEKPEDYFFSSARNYAGLDNYLEIVLESVKRRTYR